MPTLSFVVPVYNVEQFLPRCLDSLVAQSGCDLEILCVNDGATDSSPEILEDYAKRYPHLITVLHKENGGLSDARNFGLERARGEYVAFVDSDDFLREDFALLAVSKMEKEGLDLLLTDFSYYYESGRTVPVKARKGLSSDLRREALLSAPMAWMRLYRRSLLEEIRFVKGIYYEDLEMTPRALLAAKKVGFLEESVYFYVQREGSIMNQSAFNKKFLDIFKVLDRVYRAYEASGKLTEYEKEIEYLYLEHLFRSAALRFVPFRERGALMDLVRGAVKEKFPQWRNNPYLKKSSLFFRAVAYSTGNGWDLAVRFLARLKG